MTERSRGTDTRIVACEQSIFIGVFRCERFFVCEELCGLEQREPVRGLGTSCKPLSDSSQISTREEKRTSCKADNEALVVGYSYY